MHPFSNADLHAHSTVSDGTLSPAQVAQQAVQGGVSLWALTDHDEIRGLHEAREAALDAGMAWTGGVEISVTFLDRTVHIVGLGVDPDSLSLQEGLAQTRAGRRARAHAMADDLARVGIAQAFEGALQYVGNPDLISRTHFARHLVAIGRCADTHEVFQHFLKEGKPGFVPHRWAALGDAVRWIREAQGVAVVAHPARYGFTPLEEYALWMEFQGHGGLGVEVVTGSHTAAEAQRYAQVALELDLWASRGSDFHSPQENHTRLGGLPPLPAALKPVWSLLAENGRIHSP